LERKTFTLPERLLLGFKSRAVLRVCIFIVLFIGFLGSLSEAKAAKDLPIEQKYPLLATGILKSAGLAKLPNGILLKSDGVEIKEAILREIIEKADPKLRGQLEKNLFFLLEQEATKTILIHKAQKDGISSPGLSAIQTHLLEKTKGISISDEQARTFYDANKAMVGGMPFDQVKESIRGFLLKQKQQQAIQSYIQDLGKKTDIRVNLDWVKEQHALARDNPVDRARASGRPTMVEFGATGCIPCDMMQPILDNLRKKYPRKLNVVFVHVREKQILGARFGIRSIPVQVFFDQHGREFFRHEGFFSEKKVVEIVSKMGVQ